MQRGRRCSNNGRHCWLHRERNRSSWPATSYVGRFDSQIKDGSSVLTPVWMIRRANSAPHPVASTVCNIPVVRAVPIGRQRKCKNKRKYSVVDWVDVGEYHTHPPAPAEVERWVCKPPSHFDVYQLLMACMNQRHNFQVVVSHDGIYTVTADRPGISQFSTDLRRYYQFTKHTVQETMSSIEQCRQPILKTVKGNGEQFPYLHKLLVQHTDACHPGRRPPPTM